jgi:hypothetical protein
MKPMITWRFRPSHYTVFSIETQGDDWGSPILHHRDDSPPVHLIWTYTPRETAGCKMSEPTTRKEEGNLRVKHGFNVGGIQWSLVVFGGDL